MWLSPSIRVKWGAYFDSDPQEQQQIISLAQAALGKGPGLVGAQPLITRRQAVEFIAPIIGIENVDAAMAALEAEGIADAAANAEKLKAQQAAMTPAAPAAAASNTTSVDDKSTEPKGAPPAAPPKK